MATMGARLGELLDIDRVRDINLETNTITIDTSLAMDGSGRPLKTTRKIFVQPRAVLEMTPRSKTKKTPIRRQRLSLLTFGVFWFIWSLLEVSHGKTFHLYIIYSCHPLSLYLIPLTITSLSVYGLLPLLFILFIYINNRGSNL